MRNSPFKDDIEYLGRVTKEQKIELIRKSHVILVTSVKEGWGLIVTEAASQGTPAIVYDVDGLRDSIRDKETIIHPDQKSLTRAILRFWDNQSKLQIHQLKLLEDTVNFSSRRSAKEFLHHLQSVS